jgi:hypothetical protein
MYVIRTLSVFIVAGCAATAERPEIGVFMGYPVAAPFDVQNLPYFNNSFDCGPDHPGQLCGTFESAGRRPMLGVSVFVPLTGRIAFRISALYQRISLGTEFVTPYALPGAVSTYTIESVANRWELPLSARWRFTKHFNAGVGGTVSTLTGAETLDTAVYLAAGGGYGTTVYRPQASSFRSAPGSGLSPRKLNTPAGLPGTTAWYGHSIGSQPGSHFVSDPFAATALLPIPADSEASMV